MGDSEITNVKEENIGDNTFKISVESFVIVKVTTTEGTPLYTVKQDSLYSELHINKLHDYIIKEIMPRYKK